MNAASLLKSMFNFAAHVFSSLLPKQPPVRLGWSLPFFSLFAEQSCPSLEWRGCLQPWTCKLTSEGEPQGAGSSASPTSPHFPLPPTCPVITGSEMLNCSGSWKTSGQPFPATHAPIWQRPCDLPAQHLQAAHPKAVLLETRQRAQLTSASSSSPDVSMSTSHKSMKPHSET